MTSSSRLVELAREINDHIPENILKKEMARPLSNVDLEEMMENKAKIVLYSQLRKYHNITDLLHPFNCTFILYEQRPGYGHWCVLIKHKDWIEFFDPYAYFIDDQLQWTSPEERVKLKMNYPYLTKLLLTAPKHYSIIYNEHPFQKFGKGISTCGRHCVLRGTFKNLTLEEYVKMFGKDLSKMDKTVTLLTIPDEQQ